MSVELVIARYNEDINWLDKVKNKKITIYNKGIDNIKYKSIKLENIGRESHTYLTHIIENYDNLSDITIFSQGDPFFHSPDFLKLIEDVTKFQPVQALTSCYSPSLYETSEKYKKFIISKELRREGHPPYQFKTTDKSLWINNINIYVEYYNKDGIVLYPHYYRDYSILHDIDYFKYIFKFKSILQFMKERYKLNNIKLNTLVPMSYAAIFSVSKEAILSRTKKFYENILYLLIDDYNKYKIDTGLLLERLWLSIFNYQKYNKLYKKLNSKDYSIQYYNVKIKNNIGSFNIDTLLPLYILLLIDNIKYILIIGYKSIFLKKNDKQIYNTNFKKEILDKKDNSIEIKLDNKLYLTVNNILCCEKIIDEKNINSIKIEESYIKIK